MSDDDIEQLIDVAYQLAKIYHQDPDVFLRKPIDDLVADNKGTQKMMQRAKD